MVLRNIRPFSREAKSEATSTWKVTGPLSASMVMVSIGRPSGEVSACGREQAPSSRNTMAAKTRKRMIGIPGGSAALLRVFTRRARAPRFKNSQSGIENVDLGRQLALRAIAGAHAHALALTQFADAVAPERFHMDEDIGGVRPARHETVAFATVEPFNGRFERRALGLGGEARLALHHGLRRGGGIVERAQPPRLQALWSLHRFADDARALIGRLEAGLAHAGLMQEDIALRSRRRLDEPITLGKIEPLNEACNLQWHFAQ